ncbi:MAG TPA: SulP family inorganic anion transporter [Anaerolineales bacterium]|nr:SulP family inorganic anion transporter [Anaerolineales bacterium]
MSLPFDFRKLLPVASIGLVGGVILLPLTISFALLMFSAEDLSPFASTGIGLVLFGAFIMQLIIALMSSFPGMMGGPQDSPAAILSLTALVIATHMQGASAEAKFITVVMTIILTSVVSGLFFVMIGTFQLSRLVRFIPYPVVGGFVAGTGLLLTQGALGVMLGKAPGIADLGVLLKAETLFLWVPGFLFGAIVLVASRRSTHYLTYPVLLIGAVLFFYLFIWLGGYDLQQARQMGWLLGPFPQGTLWRPLDLSLLRQVDWAVIAGQSTNIFAVSVISLVGLLLNASALELIAQKDVDLNRELISTGIANLAGGLAGGSVGYHYLGVSALAFRMGISSRLVAFFGASVTGLALLFDASLLSLIPKLVAGGLILFVGLSFLVEWLYDAWFQLPRIDYVLVWVILIVVGAVGFLEGVGTGIAIAIILFVVNYSRIGIVKDTLTGKSYQSNVERPLEQRQIIKEAGEHILILRLQGFIFFGTSQSLVSQVNARVKDPTRVKLRFLILDFQHVSALDASALFGFVRLKQMATGNQFHLIFSETNKDIKDRLARNGFEESEELIRFFPTMDYGMEWCESRLLVDEGSSSIIRAGSLKGQLQKLLPSSEYVEKFMTYVERREARQYHILINQGDPPDCMFFIDSGEVTTRLEMSKGKFIRLKSQRGGTMVGEMGLFLKQPRTATVVVSEPSVLYRLSVDAYERMMQDDPDLVFALHQWITRVLATRLTENNSTLEVLLN